MNQYKNVLCDILSRGTWQQNRTGIDSIKLPYPAVTMYHMDEGFPALTGRRAPFKSAMGELCGFARGVTSAADFRALGCKFWDQNANENAHWLANPFRKGEDDLGDVYGAQWRRWPAYEVLPLGEQEGPKAKKLLQEGWKLEGFIDPTNGWGFSGVLYKKVIDQLGDAVRTIINNPDDRRILFHAWNPAKLGQIALPACHLQYQFVPTASTKELALTVTIRSNDMPLGYPSNVMEAAALLHLVARLTGFKPTWLTIISVDAHIYANQLDMVKEYLDRPISKLPKLVISERVPTLERFNAGAYIQMAGDGDEDVVIDHSVFSNLVGGAAVEWLDLVEPSDFTLEGYEPGEPITAPMAV